MSAKNRSEKASLTRALCKPKLGELRRQGASKIVGKSSVGDNNHELTGETIRLSVRLNANTKRGANLLQASILLKIFFCIHTNKTVILVLYFLWTRGLGLGLESWGLTTSLPILIVLGTLVISAT
jgi:hypothetical protein